MAFLYLILFFNFCFWWNISSYRNAEYTLDVCCYVSSIIICYWINFGVEDFHPHIAFRSVTVNLFRLSRAIDWKLFFLKTVGIVTEISEWWGFMDEYWNVWNCEIRYSMLLLFRSVSLLCVKHEHYASTFFYHKVSYISLLIPFCSKIINFSVALISHIDVINCWINPGNAYVRRFRWYIHPFLNMCTVIVFN